MNRRGFLKALLAGAAVAAAPAITIVPAEQPVLAAAVANLSIAEIRAAARAALAAWWAERIDRLLLEELLKTR